MHIATINAVSIGSLLVVRRTLPTDSQSRHLRIMLASVMSASNYAGDMIELDRISGVGRPADVINPPHLYITYGSCQQNYTVQIKERTLIH